MPRAARATTTTLSVALSMLALLAFAHPSYAAATTRTATGVPLPGAGSPADGTTGDPVYDPQDPAATISGSNSHAGGYIANEKRYVANPTAHSSAVPNSVDLRNYAPAVGDQGSVGQCVAWTITRNIMGYFVNKSNGAGVDSPYAPLFLYMRNVAAGGAPSRGLNPDSVLANIQANGVDSQDDYFQGTSNYKVAPTSAQIANATNYRISGWARLFSGANQGANAKTVIQQALANGLPVAIGISVYQDFMDLGEHSLYTTTSGTSLGGHMITAFGYDEDGLYIRNQWGTSWGNNGDAHLSWNFVQTVVSGAYTIAGVSTPSSPVGVTPQVTGLSLSSGSAGASVTITGAGLAKATGVTFGGTAATFSKSTANGVTRLLATVPKRAGGTVDIAVTNSTGTSDTGGSADDFTLVQAAPALTGISPSTTSRDGGATITLSGTNLTGASAVRIGSMTAEPASVSDTSVTFVAPATTSTGNLAVTVTTGGGTSNSRYLTYLASGVPTITRLTPSSGPSTKTTTVVVTGTNLVNVRSVKLGSTALSYTAVSSTQLKIFVKARTAGSASLVVVTAGGTSNALAYAAVKPARPSVKSLSPAKVITTATTSVTVTGVGFTGASRVSVGGKAVSFSVASDTSLTLRAPARRAGKVLVVVVAPGGTASYKYLTYATTVAPVISSLSRTSGSYRSMTATTVTGRHLSKVTLVTASGKRTSFKRVNDTRMTVTLARHARGTVRIQARSAGGLSNAVTFTYR